MPARASQLKPKVSTVACQPSWIVANDQVQLAITQLGGHMAPVTFYRKTSHSVQPYYVNPWHAEKLKFTEPVLNSLRGDFFCLPFGGNVEPVRGRKHFCHGETAGSTWRLLGLAKSGPVTQLALTMKTKVQPGTVTKRISLLDGQNVVYCQHILEGYSGSMPLGHHPTLAVPDEEGAMCVTTSEFSLGMTNPAIFSDPKNREYQSLAIGATFKRLDRVPTLWKSPALADCTAFPVRQGFTDLLAVFNRPNRSGLAWTTAVVQKAGYMWFSIKNPAVLPATVFWICNRGRHASPWSGRSRCLGLEDVCGFFADGLSASTRSNLLTRRGIPTAVKLSPDTPFMVNHIQGVVKVPANFKKVRTVEFLPGAARFVSVTGKAVEAKVDHQFALHGVLGA